jgi:hypothetical protein
MRLSHLNSKGSFEVSKQQASMAWVKYSSLQGADMPP